jgi:hypothetical protein
VDVTVLESILSCRLHLTKTPVKEVLGHADYETTLRYTCLALDYLKSVVRKRSLGLEMLAFIEPANERLVGSKTGSEKVESLIVVRPTGLEPVTF